MKIEGLKESIDALDNLNKKVEKTIIKKGQRAGLKPMLAMARAEAPIRTGVLRKAIKIRSGGTGNGSSHMTISLSKKDFSGDAFYGYFILGGYHVGPRRLGDARTLVPANNFLVRAFDAVKEETVTTAGDTWKELIEAEANK